MDKTETMAKWKLLIESKDDAGEDLGFGEIKSLERKQHTATLLENTEKYLTENKTTGIDNIDPVIINLVRRTAPNLMAYDMVGVQPMKGPTGIVFAMRAHYGDQPQGPFGRPGDARTGFQTGASLTSGRTPAQTNAFNGKATNEALYNESNTAFSGTGTQSANDGTVAYTAYDTGVGFSTSAGETLGRGQTGDLDWATMSITIEKQAVEAKERGLRTNYTIEVQQDLKAVHGLDAETELSNILSTEITAEINREIVNTIRKVAKIAPGEIQYQNGSPVLDSNGAYVLGTAGLYDLDVNSDGRWSAEKHKSLLLKINKEANAIAKDTRRGRGNFIICSSDVAAVLDLAGKIDYAPAVDNNLNADDTGKTFIGMLQGRYKVYIDPYIAYDEVIVGYKGSNQFDAGLFYCPYIPLTMQKAVDPNTMQPIMAFKTRYGMLANPFTTLERNNNSYFRKFKVSGI